MKHREDGRNTRDLDERAKIACDAKCILSVHQGVIYVRPSHSAFGNTRHPDERLAVVEVAVVAPDDIIEVQHERGSLRAG